ncbi:hypothetical protein Goari_020476 [Gossypium aridum]|uniref:Uncharacterized protein n=1 Tax=Gossypium aridum TaxID=34290 RepID=A0A7J8YPY6_GOSAI|nr:hypothetical protein [Gossypium aridum]
MRPSLIYLIGLIKGSHPFQKFWLKLSYH